MAAITDPIFTINQPRGVVSKQYNRFQPVIPRVKNNKLINRIEISDNFSNVFKNNRRF